MTLKPIRNRLIASAAASFALTDQAAFADEDHESKEAWRLFITDHSQPVVRAIGFETARNSAATISRVTPP